jgi:hypothetical protein
MTEALVVGGCGVLGVWVKRLVEQAIRLNGRDGKLVRTLERLEPIEGLPSDDGPIELISFCEFPHFSCVSAIEQGTFPILAVIDEPVDMARYFTQSGVHFIEAVRACSLSMSLNRSLFDRHNVFLITRGDSGSVQSIISGLLTFLEIALDRNQLDELMKSMGLSDSNSTLEAALEQSVERYVPLTEIKDHLSNEQVEIAAQCLSPLVYYVWEEAPPSIVWSYKVLHSTDMQGGSLPLALDLTGGARDLTYGPYICLPPRKYKVSLTVGFTKEVIGTRFRTRAVQLFGDRTIAEGFFAVPSAGIFLASLIMDKNISHEPIEILLSIAEGAIDGRISLAKIEIDLLENDSTPLVEYNPKSEDFR